MHAGAEHTVWCSFHTAACNHLATHRLVAFVCLFFLFFLFFWLLLLLLLWWWWWWWCSARARRCRAQCDVLVIPQLVTILSHIFLSHFCACSFSSSYSSSCCCCCCNTAYFRIFADPCKSSKTIGAKKSVNADVFCASEAQNHGIYHDFCIWKEKSRHFQCFCASA